MLQTTQIVKAKPVEKFPISTGRRHAARAFAGGRPSTIEIQAVVRFRVGRERGGIVASGVPRARIQQTITAVLGIEAFGEVPAEHLRLDVHRGDEGRYRHHYGLALAAAMVSSLGRKPIPAECLFVGDVGLTGEVRDAQPELIDALNDAIDSYEVESPVTVLLAPSSAAWVRSSSNVQVIAVRTLGDVIAAVWPGVRLLPY